MDKMDLEQKPVNILMIEDDEELAEIIAEYLEKFDMKVDIAREPYMAFKACFKRVSAHHFGFDFARA